MIALAPHRPAAHWTGRAEDGELHAVRGIDDGPLAAVAVLRRSSTAAARHQYRGPASLAARRHQVLQVQVGVAIDREKAYH